MEGPSLVILKEEMKRFEKKKVLKVSGHSQEPIQRLKGRTLKRIVTFGKILYLIFSDNIVTRTHFLLFGSYRIDEDRGERSPRLQLTFENGVVCFYACAFRMDAQDDFALIDERVDVLSKHWDEKYVLKLLKGKENSMLGDLFLDQSIFAGSGNIVRNEVLFNFRRHPLIKLSDIETRDRKKIVQSIRVYCENFYDWKKKSELTRHFQVYKRKTCRNCERKLRYEHLGKGKRATWHCPVCQSKKLTHSKLVLHQVIPVAPGGAKEKRFDH